MLREGRDVDFLQAGKQGHVISILCEGQDSAVFHLVCTVVECCVQDEAVRGGLISTETSLSGTL